MQANPNVDFGSKPKFVMCFNCGREFSKASLEIHFYQCLKKSENENNKHIETPKEYLIFFDKIKTNKNISYGEIEDFNNFSNNLYKEKTLCACPFCNRKFQKDRLEVHLRSCKPAENKSPDNVNKLLNKNLIKELNKNKSVDKISMGNKLKKSNIEIDENNYNSLNYKEQKCSNCGDVMDMNKISMHLKKCNGKGKNNKENKLKSTSVNKFSNQNQKEKNEGKNANFTDTVRPAFLVCYICGREFGKKSLEIHLKSCVKKYLTTEGIDPDSKNALNSLPIAPDCLDEILYKCNNEEKINHIEFDNYNKQATNIYNNISLKRCLGCNRTFTKEALEVHLRSCKSGQKEKEKEDNSHMKITQRPRMLMCPLCGREFGSLSLDIHIKSCKKKFDIEQENLPSNLRRKSENILDKYYQQKKNSEMLAEKDAQGLPRTKGAYNIQEMNDQAYEIYAKESLAPCENCGRTFLPDRLLVHLRSCKGKK